MQPILITDKKMINLYILYILQYFTFKLSVSEINFKKYKSYILYIHSVVEKNYNYDTSRAT